MVFSVQTGKEIEGTKFYKLSLEQKVEKDRAKEKRVARNHILEH